MKKLTIILIFIVLFSFNSNIVYAADTTVTSAYQGTDASDAVWGPYWTDVNTAVIVFMDDFEDISYASTTDAGVTWNVAEIQVGALEQMAAWFDKETPGDTGDLVHIAWLDRTSDLALYVNVDATTGVVGTIRTVASGLTVSSTANQQRVSITKTVSGNLLYAYSTQVEIGALKSDDNFATAGTGIADVFETGTEEDWVMMYPANTDDDNDAAALFWNRSGNDIFLKMYDDSADTWTATLIDNDGVAEDSVHKNMDAAVRHSDSAILLALHSNDDASTDDLRTYEILPDSIASPTVTTKTRIFTDQVESAQIGMIINQQNDDVYVAYLKGGTWQSLTDIVYHKSDDGMTTWGSEQVYSEAAADDNRVVHGGRTVGDDGGRIQWAFYNDDTLSIYVNLVNDIEIEAVVSAAKVIRLSGVRLSGIRLY